MSNKPKARFEVGYSKSGEVSRDYHSVGQESVVGADGLFIDGKGNTIQVYVRDMGYRILLNGKEIAQG